MEEQKLKNKISGIYLAQIKYELFWLKDTEKNTEEAFNLKDFELMLSQRFMHDQILKILEALYSENKLIINFNDSKVKIIKEKDQPFIKEFAKYFTAEMAQAYQDNLEDATNEDELYKAYYNI
ncbi:MAG: hypothetical protein IKO49_02075 [Bacilli bacterium]|nr:hypothetical protein [Clostridia bacterium]MBR4618068.1 hypothetical protein [Bacilli bacterium]